MSPFRYAAVFFLAGCASAPPSAPPRPALVPIEWREDSRALQIAVLNRVSWGANRTTFDQIAAVGSARWLARQLEPAPAALPAEAQAAIDAMTLSRRPIEDIASELERQRRAFQTLPEGEKKADRQAYQQELGRLGREAQARTLLRAIYAPNQLQEHMTWFWMNHFNVYQFKGPLRALIGDYEERAIRPHALGRFRDLLDATARHPAMLIYLDNARNSAGRINENYARELMELHTLGVGGGYSQRDVQELARVLTGFGVDPQSASFHFYPRRHDPGTKALLGTTIRNGGAGELDQALDLLARHPATARFIRRKLAVFFVADEPPPALVERMTQTFGATDGDIAQVLRTLFVSPEFRASLGAKFKDPMHYTISALPLVLASRPLPAAQPVIGALARMGQPLFARPTPDGYPLTRTDWASAGQLTARFEIARGIAYRVPDRLWQGSLA